VLWPDHGLREVRFGLDRPEGRAVGSRGQCFT
jgi:hypothetical protein